MKNAPPSPDFVGATEAQSQASRQMTAEQLYANRPNISTPFGGIRWTPPSYDPYYGDTRYRGGDPGRGGTPRPTPLPPPPGSPLPPSPSPYPGGNQTPPFNPNPGMPSAPSLYAGGSSGFSEMAGAQNIGQQMYSPSLMAQRLPVGDDGPGVPRAPVPYPTTPPPSGGTPAPAPGSNPLPGGRPPAFDPVRPGGDPSDQFGEPGPLPGQWGMELYLSPEQQAALDAQQRLGRQRSGLAEQMFGRVQGELGEAPDWSTLPEAPDAGAARQRAEDALYQRQTSRLDPEWQKRQEQMDIGLRNQGVVPGSAAYKQQMDDFERAREGAYSSARQEAIMGGGAEAERTFGMGLTARQSAMAETLQKRGWSLNEINALLSGQQVGMPQMPGFSQAGAAQPPNYLGAAQSGYQAQLNQFLAQQQQQQAMLSGGASLASLYFGGGGATPYSF